MTQTITFIFIAFVVGFLFGINAGLISLLIMVWAAIAINIIEIRRFLKGCKDEK